MKKLFTLLSLIPTLLFAQSYSNSALTAIPNNQTDLNIPVLVQGLPNTIDATFGISSVCIDISHQHMIDLKVRLRSPQGTEIILADQNGDAGSGYHSVCFSEDGNNGWVTSIDAPYTGSYIPTYSLNTFNSGENPNGIWNLVITDMFNFLDTGYFHSMNINFSAQPPSTPSVLFVCTTSDAGGCVCPDGSQDCDLLPDMTAACTNWVTPYTESAGYLNVSTATPNVGYGPLEIHGTSNCFCDQASVPCSTSLCPDGSTPKIGVNQRVYHKNGSIMTYWDRPAGTMAYHPSHSHIHVDDWIWIDVRRKNGDPNPTHWPKTGLGSKQSYCLINLGDCSAASGVCHDENGQVMTSANIPNYSLGSVTGCDSTQGIYVGKYDTYGSISVNLPPSTCNGDYYIVSITDPLNSFLEQNDTNNWTVIPVTLTRQLGVGNFEPEGFYYTVSSAQLNCLSNSFTSDSMRWDWGDGSVPTTYYASPVSVHNYTTQGTFIVKEFAYNHCGLTFSADTISIVPTSLDGIAKTIVSWNVYPNPAKDKINIEYTLANMSDVKIEITDALGRVMKELSNENQYTGKYHVSLNLETEEIKQGIYFVRITTNNKIVNERFVVLK